MGAMKADFEEALDDKRQDFEASREELKVLLSYQLSDCYAMYQTFDIHGDIVMDPFNAMENSNCS